jgi:hypothetical protein
MHNHLLVRYLQSQLYQRRGAKKAMTTDLDRSVSRRFGTVSDDGRVRRTSAALEANGISVLRAADAAEAKQMVLGLIPDRSQIHHGASQSLKVSGIIDEIEKSGRYEPVRVRIWSMDRKTQADEIRRLTSSPDVNARQRARGHRDRVAGCGLGEWQPARPVRSRCRASNPRPSVDLLTETRQLAQAADAAGLEYIAIQDHAYNPGFLDVWTLITYLAADTDRISFFPDVADLQLRPPTMLAKAAASLSVLTGGRIALGVGGGATADGIAAMGGIRRNGREMVAFTDEALQIMRRALAGDVVEFRGGQHTIGGYSAGPVPSAPVPLWLGSLWPRMLAVTGRSSDGWISPLSTYLTPPAVPPRQQLIDEAALSADATRRPCAAFTTLSARSVRRVAVPG